MLSKLHKYGALNNHDLLKFLAVILMVVDHVGLYLFPENQTMRAIGRACIPLWFFFIGYYKPSKESYELYFYAAAVMLAKNLYGADFVLDILVTFIVVRWLLNLAEKHKLHQNWVLVPFMLAALFTPLALVISSYGSVGFLLAYSAYLKRIDYKYSKEFLAASVICYLATQQLIFQFSVLPMLIMCALSAFTAWLTYIYENKTHNISATPIKVIARYSLEFYFLHIVILMLISLI